MPMHNKAWTSFRIRTISGLCLIALASMAVFIMPLVHATSLYSVNAIKNPGFEDTSPISLCADPSRCTWVSDLYDDGNYKSTIGLDNSRALTGLQSAKLDVSENATAIKTNTTTTGFLHITMYQTEDNSTMNTVSNVTDRPDGFSLWFYIEPKATGFSMFEIRIRSYSSSELDYFFVNPVLGNPASNSTNNSEGGTPTKGYLLPTPPLGKWVHLQRNLYQDWTTPMILPDGHTTAPGLRLDDSIQRIEFDALFSINNPTTGAILAETVWVDNVVLYHNSNNPPPPPLPSNYWTGFNFEDMTGGDISSLVQWRLFNSTGDEVTGYVRGNPTLTLEPYTVAVYFPIATGQNPEPYQIFSQRVATLNTTIVVPLAVFHLATSPWSYIAFNNSITSQDFKITTEDLSTLQFQLIGNQGPALILVDSISKPILVLGNNNDPAYLPWSYDTTLSVVRIPTPTLGNFSIFLTPPVPVPRVTFQDISGKSVTTNISWKIFDSQGNQVTSQYGSYLQTGTYTFRAYYAGYPIYTSPLTSVPNTIALEMVRLDEQATSYLAVNATVTSLSISNSASRLQFTIVGKGPVLIVANVPVRPLRVERDGVPITGWTYNATTGTVAINATQLGTFNIVFSNESSIPVLYIGGAIGAAIALLAIGIILVRKRKVRAAS